MLKPLNWNTVKMGDYYSKWHYAGDHSNLSMRGRQMPSASVALAVPLAIQDDLSLGMTMPS